MTLPSLSPVARFNCGTGAAVITSENKIKLGNWHSVTLFRDGLNGWLRMDNDAPVTGKSQVGNPALAAQPGAIQVPVMPSRIPSCSLLALHPPAALCWCHRQAAEKFARFYSCWL